METNRERFLRMAREAHAAAASASGQWKRDCELVARIWQAMAEEELEYERRTSRRRAPK
jgi:hypothetical protein